MDDLRVEWTDLRLLVRQTADLLLRYELIEAEVNKRIQDLARAGPPLEQLITRWFNEKAAPDLAEEVPWPDGLDHDAADQILTLACAVSRTLFRDRAAAHRPLHWTRAYCPLCGGDPELAVITRNAERLLICSRCGTRWRSTPPPARGAATRTSRPSPRL